MIDYTWVFQFAKIGLAIVIAAAAYVQISRGLDIDLIDILKKRKKKPRAKDEEDAYNKGFQAGLSAHVKRVCEGFQCVNSADAEGGFWAAHGPELLLADNIDVARGDLLGDTRQRPVVADQFAAHVIWMAEEPLLPGRSYLMRIGTAWTLASVSAIKYSINVADMTHLAATTLSLNDIGMCNLSTSLPVAFDPYEENRETGCFILVDRETDHTVGAGMISFALRRATNIHREPLAADKSLRARMKHQTPCILWPPVEIASPPLTPPFLI